MTFDLARYLDARRPAPDIAGPEFQAWHEENVAARWARQGYGIEQMDARLWLVLTDRRARYLKYQRGTA